MHPEHDVTLPFTRMVAGPMDYTPGAMRNAVRGNFAARHTQPMSRGTRAHQLAMYVVYGSPLQMLADSPSNYEREPDAMDLLGPVPTVWDETRVLPGSAIGRLAAFARRAGEDWFVGVLNGTEEARSWSTDLGFLGSGEFVATLYRDAAPHRTLPAIETGRVLEAGQDNRLSAELSGGGGFVAWIRPNRKP